MTGEQSSARFALKRITSSFVHNPSDERELGVGAKDYPDVHPNVRSGEDPTGAHVDFALAVLAQEKDADGVRTQRNGGHAINPIQFATHPTPSSTKNIAALIQRVASTMYPQNER